MDYRLFFKNKLRELRQKSGETQVQAAKALGVSPRFYQSLELGENLPGIELFFALADHFSVSLDELAGRNEEERRP